MHALTNWFIRNPVAANLVMALILFMGVMTALTIRIEGFPRIPAENIEISTYYRGSTAEQVDELITRKIEKGLEGLDGVRSISSTSSAASSMIYVRKSGSQDLQKLLDKIRIRVDSIGDLPQSARRPVIQTGGFDIPALYVNLHGDTDPRTLQKLAERLREQLLAEPELSRLQIWGLHEREMQIEVLPSALERLNLTVAQVAQSIRRNSVDFQSGSLRTAGGDIFLRADNKARFASDYARIPVLERPDGSVVLLGDVAQVTDGFADRDYLFRFNGEPTVGMVVQVGRTENLLTISKVVKETVEEFRQILPPEVQTTVWGDASSYISDRLQLLQTNGFQGLLLVGLMLSLFLNVRLAFWVAMGIPISVMGALAVAGTKWVDYSLNDITTFGLIIALGILVDDAVVVGESVFEERKKHKDPLIGTEAGVRKVAVATVFGVLTTIAAFFPLLMINNPLGKVLAGFSGMVILALLFSLFESKFILPAHLAHIDMDKEPRNFVSRGWAQVQSVFKRGLAGFRDTIYAPTLRLALIHRYAVLVLFFAMAALGIGLIYKGKVKTTFFPEVPGQVISLSMQMDKRAPFALTRDNILFIQDIGDALNAELAETHSLAQPPIRNIFFQLSDPRSAELYAELTPVADRPGLGILDILRDWQTRVGQLEGTVELSFSGTEELGGGFQIRLFSKDTDLLAKASDEVRAYLDKIEGVSNLRSSLQGGAPELTVRLKPEARHLGFSTETLATQIGYRFGGAEVQKIQRDDQEVRVIVRNATQARNTIDDLMQSRLRNEAGDWVPLLSVAEVSGRYVPSSITRRNGKQLSTVSASIDKSKVAPEEISQAMFETLVPDLAERYPSVDIRAGGELEEIGEVQGGLKQALLLAMVLIYVLMAVPLKSYWQPVIIVSVVPFGFVGATIGHLIMDVPLSLLSFFGMLALTGVVVNDSLVMVTRYNDARNDGHTVHEALKDAGIGRFQAIFLTTATTVIGLMPLLSETSEQAQYLIPAAISLAYGEIFATLITLILIPVLLAISDDIRRFLR